MQTLGVDEIVLLAATSHQGTVFATGTVALNGRARLLDVVEGKSGTVSSSGWVSGLDQAWRDGIGVAALAPLRGFATALHGRLAGRDPGYWMLSCRAARLRRRGPGSPPGAARHAESPRPQKLIHCFFGIKRLLRSGRPPHRALLGTAASRPRRRRPAVGRAGVAAIRPPAALPGQDQDRGQAATAGRVHRRRGARDPRAVRLARTLDFWRDELLAYFDTGGVSNRPTDEPPLLSGVSGLRKPGVVHFDISHPAALVRIERGVRAPGGEGRGAAVSVGESRSCPIRTATRPFMGHPRPHPYEAESVRPPPAAQRRPRDGAESELRGREVRIR